ncbi:unnamed protein product [Amoebophrya sp. A25]|nr:unnamed protein product [Amoebophrya sp. A25]|eukprot:GSA25T00007925001.1
MPSVPREVLKWMQGMCVTHSIKDPKFDLANGYLIAQLFERYYPKDVRIYSYENGQSIECRSNNWEMLFRVFKKVKMPCTREEFDEVLHHVDDAAVLFLCKIYEFLTGKKVTLFQSPEKPNPPPFARETASWKLKDPHLERIEDNIHRTIRRIHVLEKHNDDLARDRIGPDGDGVRRYIAIAQKHDEMHTLESRKSMKKDTGAEEQTDTHGSVREQTVNALASVPGAMASQGGAPSSAAPSGNKKKVARTASVVAEVGFNQPAGVVKPVLDIVRPLILTEIDNSHFPEAAEPVAAFVDAAVREALPEAVTVRLFREKLTARAHLFVDSMLKSSIEFWIVWSVFLPILQEPVAGSPMFDAGMDFWRRIGTLCKQRNEALTQKCMLHVCLPYLVQIMHSDCAKRDPLCELVYTFLPGDIFAEVSGSIPLPRAVARLQALKSVKDVLNERLGDKFVSSYVPCLACFVDWDCSPSQPLIEHLLDLYLYYAMLAIQLPQPKLRTAGLSVLTTIAGSGSSPAVLNMIPSLKGLMYDTWWEVQGSLLVLVSTLLSKSRPTSDGFCAPAEQDLYRIIAHILQPQKVSKNVLQIGLSYLSRNLATCPDLALLYVQALVAQPASLRNRLLPKECCLPGTRDHEERVTFAEAAQQPPQKTQYVLGCNSKYFREFQIFNPGGSGVSSGSGASTAAGVSASALTSPLNVKPLVLARALCDLVNGSGDAPDQPESIQGLLYVPVNSLDRMEASHLEVLYALLQRKFLETPGDGGGPMEEWLSIYDALKKYIFVALLEPEFHALACTVLRHGFWSPDAGQTRQIFVRNSQDTFVSMYGLAVAGSAQQELVSEQELMAFLQDAMQDSELKSALKNLFRHFKEKSPEQFAQSKLQGLL